MTIFVSSNQNYMMRITLLSLFVTIFSLSTFAQTPGGINFEPVKYDMTQANLPQEIAFPFLEMQNVPVQSLEDGELTPMATLTTSRFATLDDIETGHLVYYSEGRSGNTYNIKTYDSNLDIVENISFDIPENANLIRVLNHYSTSFFNDEDTREFMVFIHHFDPDNYGPEGQINDVWVVDSNGEVLQTLTATSAMAKVDNDGNKILYTYLDDDTNITIDAFNPADFELINTHSFPVEWIYNLIGSPFNFMEIDGQEYLVTAHYEKKFMDNMTLEIAPDNHLIVKLLDYDFTEIKSISLDIQGTYDQGPYLIPMASFGVFYKTNEFDISTNIFNDDEQLEVVYGIHYYNLMTDQEWDTFRVGAEDGSIIYTLDEYILGFNRDIRDIEGHDRQIGFLIADDLQQGATQIGFFNIESWEMDLVIDAQLSEYVLSEYTNRIEVEDGYHYLVGVGQSLTENGLNYGGVNEYTSEGELVKTHLLPTSDSAILFQPLLTSNTLERELFTSEDSDLYFLYVYMEQVQGGGNFYNMAIAKDADNVLAEFRGDTDKGPITGGGLMMRSDKQGFDKLMVQYNSSMMTLDFYQLPLFGELDVESIKENKFVLYPNPVSDFIYIQSDNPVRNYNIFDINGRLVLNGNLANGQNSLDLSSLPTGIYLAGFQTADGNIIQKKLIKK